MALTDTLIKANTHKDVNRRPKLSTNRRPILSTFSLIERDFYGA
jgi:hypothetical protein